MYGPIKDILKQYKALHVKTFCHSHLLIGIACHCRPAREGSYLFNDSLFTVYLMPM